MNRLFSLSELGTQKGTAEDQDKSKIACSNYIDVHTKKIESLKQLTGNLPKENEIYFMWTINSFNAFTFIPYVLKECGVINELVISTYSINRRIVDSLMRYIDKGVLKNVTILISDSIKYRVPKIYEHLESLALQRKDKITIYYSWNHSKVAMARAEENYLVMEGSGNFSENAQYEQYILTNTKKIYDFRKQCILESINN